MNTICIIDMYILLGLLRVLRWCTEWLSWRQRTIERGLLSLFAVLLGLVCCMNHMAWIFAIYLPLLWCMCRDMQRTDRERIARLLIYRCGVARMIILLLYSSQALWDFFVTSPHLHGDRFFGFAWIVFVVAEYVTALPHSGEPGKKRKLAMEKVKEMFGTDWMVEPVDVPQ